MSPQPEPKHPIEETEQGAMVPGQSVFFGKVFFAVLPGMADRRCGHADLIVKGAWEIAQEAERRARKEIFDRADGIAKRRADTAMDREPSRS